MRSRTAILTLVVFFGALSYGLWHAVSPACANEPIEVLMAGASLPALTGTEATYTYVGNKKCKKCHIKQYKSWEQTRMAKAFEILMPGNRKEKKEEFKLDVEKDYTKDEKCIKCHTVGFGKEGGYATPDPTDKRAVRKAKKLQGVGCECCHGPGSAYIKVHEEILKSKRKYKVEELYAVGLNKIDENVCKVCHNEESPSVKPGDVFNYEERKKKGTHEHFPLKQREE